MKSDVPSHGPAIFAAEWICTPLAFVFLSLRLFCKLYKRTPPWWDDYFLITSWCILLASSILVTINVKDGFGTHTADVIAEHGPDAITQIIKRNTILGFLSPLAIAWSKTSFAVTLLHITKGKMKMAVWAIIATTNLFLITAGFTFLFQCLPVEKTWDTDVPGTCGTLQKGGYGLFAAAYSGAMDFVLALLPWTFIWKLNLRRKEKFGIAVAMSMGICAGVTAIVKCYFLLHPNSVDFIYDGGNLPIWVAGEVSTTIMATSIPVLRVLIRDVASAASRDRHSMPRVGITLKTDGSRAAEAVPAIGMEYRQLPSLKGLGGNDTFSGRTGVY